MDPNPRQPALSTPPQSPTFVMSPMHLTDSRPASPPAHPRPCLGDPPGPANKSLWPAVVQYDDKITERIPAPPVRLVRLGLCFPLN